MPSSTSNVQPINELSADDDQTQRDFQFVSQFVESEEPASARAAIDKIVQQQG